MPLTKNASQTSLVTSVIHSMRSVTLYSYSLPMEAGIILRNQRLKTRDGLVVCLKEDDKQGWGEIAPLPEFSQETLEQATQSALAWLKTWAAGQEIELPQMPSVAFGLSCALAELDGSLPDAVDYQKAPLCTGDPDELLDVLNSMPGKKVTKIKVGLYEAIRDGIIVNMFLEAIPDLHVRLDANRSWKLEKAMKFVSYIKPELKNRIDFIEEPCRTPDESREYAKQSGLALAWDETTREAGFAVKAEENLRAIILKPTLLGSLSYCKTLAEQAKAAGLDVVISSSVESSLALTQLSRLATWLTPEEPAGLDTLELMQAQLLRPWPGSELPLYGEDKLTLVWQSDN